MFGKRKPPGSGGPEQASEESRQPAESEGRIPNPAVPRARPSYEPPRRPLDATAVRRSEPRSEPGPAAGAGRKLVVGRGIRLSGEIKTCETLVVEGHVEADLNDCAFLEINESGQFLGSAVVESAEIGGLLEGSLTVRRRLLLRGSGEVRGTVRYADLEIERGGRIAGDIDILAVSTDAEATTPEASPLPESEAEAEDGEGAVAAAPAGTPQESGEAEPEARQAAAVGAVDSPARP